MSLPLNQLGDTFNKDVRAYLRNNVPDVAQILKRELTPQSFVRNAHFELTTDKKFKAGVNYFTRRTPASRPGTPASHSVWRYDHARVEVGKAVEENTYYVEKWDDVIIDNYPTRTLKRGMDQLIGGEVIEDAIIGDTTFDTKWSDSIGMYKMPLSSTYPCIQAYNAYATPLILQGLASYAAKMNWRLRLLIDGALSTLIDKFKITDLPDSNKVKLNKNFYTYEQTTDEVFLAGKDYYRKSENDYYKAIVTVGAHVKTHTGYSKTKDARYLSGKQYYYTVPAPDTLSGVNYVLLKEGTDYQVNDPIDHTTSRGIIYNPEYLGYNNYYERKNTPFSDYYLLKDETDRITPDTDRYYSAAASLETVTEAKKYYYYDPKKKHYVLCDVHPNPKLVDKYYKLVKDSTGVYSYELIDFDDPVNQKPDSFDGVAVYRLETGGEYYCIGKGSGCSMLFATKSHNNDTTTEKSKLYVPIEVGTDTQIGGKQLYVDPQNEDITRIKHMVNTFLTKYRAILLCTGREVPAYTPFKDDVTYTTEELVERINAILDNLRKYCQDPTDPILSIEDIDFRDATNEVYDKDVEYFTNHGFGVYTLINDNDKISTYVDPESKEVKISPADQQASIKATIYFRAYTARDMKLKINAIIDYIVNESYYLKAFEIGPYYLGDLEDNFWQHRGVSHLLYDMAVESGFPVETETTKVSRTYNDRWFYYDPSLRYAKELLDQINFKAFPVTSPVTGDLDQEVVDHTAVPAKFGGYFVYTGDRLTKAYPDEKNKWIPLCYVTNVYNIADAWSNCPYNSCLQVLHLTSNLLNSTTPEGVSWKEAILHPRKPGIEKPTTIMLSVLEQIETLDDRLELFLDYAPHVANIVVDIGYHVTNQFKMSMNDSIPVKEIAQEYKAGNAYCYYDTTNEKYVGITISNEAAFAVAKATYGDLLFTWNFYHNKK